MVKKMNASTEPTMVLEETTGEFLYTTSITTPNPEIIKLVDKFKFI